VGDADALCSCWPPADTAGGVVPLINGRKRNAVYQKLRKPS